MPTFSDETKHSLMRAQNGFCKACFNPIASFHHKLNNTKFHQSKFPLFIQSPMNAIGLCAKCHDTKAHEYRINEHEAQCYEEYLELVADNAAIR